MIVKILLKFGLLFILSSGFSFLANIALTSLGLIESDIFAILAISFSSLILLNILTIIFSKNLGELSFLKINTDFFTVLICTLILALIFRLDGFIGLSLILASSFCLFLERVKIKFLYNKILFLILFIVSIKILNSNLDFYFKSFLNLNLLSLVTFITTTSKVEKFMSTDGL